MDLVREEQETKKYVKSLSRLMQERQPHVPLLVAKLREREEEILRNPWAVIQWRVEAPKFMQPLFLEMVRLEKEMSILRMVDMSETSRYVRLETRSEMVQILIHEGVLELLENNDRVRGLFMKRKAFPIVGGSWELLFVQYFEITPREAP